MSTETLFLSGIVLHNKLYNYEQRLCVMPEYTTIRLSKDTVELLKELGRKDESYDKVIQRLIESYYECVEEKNVKSKVKAKAQ